MANSKKKRVKKKSITAFAMRAVYLFLLAGMLFSYVSYQVEIAEQEKELEIVNERVNLQRINNEELQDILDGSQAEIVERVARDTYNYAAPNERIFVDMSGK